jgi:PIN domain nuclease of toxin-antitoxin system
MKLILDTCAILWSVADPEKLSAHAREMMTIDSTEVYVSPISSAEIACGVDRRKIELDRHWKIWFRHFLALNGWHIVPIDLAIMEEAYSLPESFHSDPADRVIVATARLNSLVVVTGDSKILHYPHVNTIC